MILVLKLNSRRPPARRFIVSRHAIRWEAEKNAIIYIIWETIKQGKKKKRKEKPLRGNIFKYHIYWTNCHSKPHHRSEKSISLEKKILQQMKPFSLS